VSNVKKTYLKVIETRSDQSSVVFTFVCSES